jgi:translation initiation factor 1
MCAKKREGIVYSTNPDFSYENSSREEEPSVTPDQQMLYVWIDSKGRSGKTVTLIKGFKGPENQLDALAQEIKKHCGTGGSVKDKEIIIQGNMREKVVAFLLQKGYKKTKKAGG